VISLAGIVKYLPVGIACGTLPSERIPPGLSMTGAIQSTGAVATTAGGAELT
jgi:hypothetical protein